MSSSCLVPIMDTIIEANGKPDKVGYGVNFVGDSQPSTITSRTER